MTLGRGQRINWLLAALLLSSLPLETARAQDRFGTLSGRVSDESGAVIPGITVRVIPLERDQVLITRTGPYGDYTLSGIEPGAYSVEIALPGFETARFPDVEIRAGETLELDARIRIGEVTTTIEVTDVTPTVRPYGLAVVQSIPGFEFDRLPNGRTFDSLAITAPGVNAGVLGGGVQLLGATGSENRILIDGAPTQSLVDGRLRIRAPFEYLDQVQITTSGIAAEHAGSMGGILAVSTRSGTNAFHGGIDVYYNNDALSAGPVPRLVLDPLDESTVGYVQDGKDIERGVEASFALGGPLVRDDLYFFAAWTPASIRRERAYALATGATPATFLSRGRMNTGLAKLSFEPTDRIRGYVSMLRTPASATGTLAEFNAFGPNYDTRTLSALEINRERGYFQPQSSLASALDLALGEETALSLGGHYVWDDYKDTGIPQLSSVEYRTSAVGLAGVPPELQQGVGFTNTPRVMRVAWDRTSRAGGNVDATFTWDAHTLAAGYGLSRRINSVEAAFPGGGYVFVYWDAEFAASPNGGTDRGAYGYYEVHDVATRGSTGALSQAMYVQDQWQVRPGLTLSLGLRLESERVPAFRADDSGQPLDVAFGWGQKLSPRVGASWSPGPGGRVRVYGSYGRIFDESRYEWVRSALGGSIWQVRYRSLDTTDVFSLSGTNLPGRDLWIPQLPDSYRDLASVDFGTAVDPNLRPPMRHEYAFGMDYRWNPQTTLGVRYTRSQLVRVIEDFARIVNGNAVFTYANPGEAAAANNQFPSTSTPLHPFPRPSRNYDAIDLTVSRSFSGGWFGQASYTWSRLEGNYAGLANTDDLRTPTLGFGHPTSQQQASSVLKPGSYTTVAWDLDEVLFDSRGNLDVRGPLPMDRPHVLKLSGGYDHPWGTAGTTEVGVFFFAGSGTPLTTKVDTLFRLPVLVNGRADMGRTPALSYTDLRVGHAFDLTEGHSLRVELTMLNVFDQKTALHRFEHLNRGAGGSRDSSAIDLSQVNLYDGYDYDALILASPDGANAYDPRYGMDDFFREGFQGRLGIKWEF